MRSVRTKLAHRQVRSLVWKPLRWRTPRKLGKCKFIAAFYTSIDSIEEFLLQSDFSNGHWRLMKKRRERNWKVFGRSWTKIILALRQKRDHVRGDLPSPCYLAHNSPLKTQTIEFLSLFFLSKHSKRFRLFAPTGESAFALDVKFTQHDKRLSQRKLFS